MTYPYPEGHLRLAPLPLKGTCGRRGKGEWRRVKPPSVPTMPQTRLEWLVVGHTTEVNLFTWRPSPGRPVRP